MDFHFPPVGGMLLQMMTGPRMACSLTPRKPLLLNALGLLSALQPFACRQKVVDYWSWRVLSGFAYGASWPSMSLLAACRRPWVDVRAPQIGRRHVRIVQLAFACKRHTGRRPAAFAICGVRGNSLSACRRLNACCQLVSNAFLSACMRCLFCTSPWLQDYSLPLLVNARTHCNGQVRMQLPHAVAGFALFYRHLERTRHMLARIRSVRSECFCVCRWPAGCYRQATIALMTDQVTCFCAPRQIFNQPRITPKQMSVDCLLVPRRSDCTYSSTQGRHVACCGLSLAALPTDRIACDCMSRWIVGQLLSMLRIFSGGFAQHFPACLRQNTCSVMAAGDGLLGIECMASYFQQGVVDVGALVGHGSAPNSGVSVCCEPEESCQKAPLVVRTVCATYIPHIPPDQSVFLPGGTGVRLSKCIGPPACERQSACMHFCETVHRRNRTDAKGCSFMLRRLLEVGELLLGAALSCIAVMAASLLRLLACAIGLKGGRCNVDPAIRGVRAVTFGAPLGFWKVFMVSAAIVVCPALASGNDRILHPTPEQIDDQIGHIEARVEGAMQHLDLFTRRWLGDEDNPPQQLRPPPVAPDDVVVDVEEILVPVRILRFQRTEQFTAVWAAPGSSPEQLIARATEETLSEGDRHYHLLEVYPQPDDEVVSLIMAPRWWRRSALVPIAIDPTEFAKPIYTTNVPRTAYYGDVCQATSPMNPRFVDGLSIAVEHNREPMSNTDVAFMTEGTLVRVIHSARFPDPLVDLEVAMGNLDWVHDVQAHGLPRARRPEGRLLVTLSDHDVIIHVAYPPSDHALQDRLATLLRVSVREMEVIWPQHEIADVEHKRRPVMGVVSALKLSDWVDRDRDCAVFIDARDLARPVSFHVFRSRWIPVEQLFRAINFQLPADIVVYIKGHEYFDADHDAYVFTHGAVVTLWCATPGEEAEADLDRDSGSSDGEGDGRSLDPTRETGPVCAAGCLSQWQCTCR